MGNQKDKKLHGNKARVDLTKEVTSLYATNAVTLPQTERDRTGKPPITNDLLVEQAREFSEENKQ